MSNQIPKIIPLGPGTQEIWTGDDECVLVCDGVAVAARQGTRRIIARTMPDAGVARRVTQWLCGLKAEAVDNEWLALLYSTGAQNRTPTDLQI